MVWGLNQSATATTLMVWGLNQSPHLHYADGLGPEPVTPPSLLVVWVWDQSYPTVTTDCVGLGPVTHSHYWLCGSETSHPAVTTDCVGLGPVTPPSLLIVWVWDQSP